MGDNGVERLEIIAPSGFPLVQPHQSLGPLIIDVLRNHGLALHAGDILVVAQKIVSKSEDRFVRLDQVEVSAEARDVARRCRKDPRLVELILRESDRVIRCVPGVLIVRHKRGFVHANAGIDRSNIPGGDEQVLLLPEDPDRSAAELRSGIREHTGVDVGVIIADSFGRAWRLGTCGVCIGSAGVEVLKDLRGTGDLYGRELEVTEVAQGDEIAAAASVLMGAAKESRPLVLVRGLALGGCGDGRSLVRPPELDLFL